VFAYGQAIDANTNNCHIKLFDYLILGNSNEVSSGNFFGDTELLRQKVQKGENSI